MCCENLRCASSSLPVDISAADVNSVAARSIRSLRRPVSCSKRPLISMAVLPRPSAKAFCALPKVDSISLEAWSMVETKRSELLVRRFATSVVMRSRWPEAMSKRSPRSRAVSVRFSAMRLVLVVNRLVRSEVACSSWPPRRVSVASSSEPSWFDDASSLLVSDCVTSATRLVTTPAVASMFSLTRSETDSSWSLMCSEVCSRRL